MLFKPTLSLGVVTMAVRCLHLSYPQLASVPAETFPIYNHGLSGEGKSRRHLKKSNLAVDLKLKGEILFGIHPIHLALKSGRRKVFHCLYVYDNFDSKVSPITPNVERILRMASHMGLSIKRVKKTVLNQLAGDRPHQGVCLDVAELPCPTWNATTGDLSCSTVWLYLQNVKDPMNFGAILRTSFYLGVDRVIVPQFNSCKLSPVVSKASAGALEVIDLQRLSRSTKVSDLCQWWTANGGEIIAADSSQEGPDDQSCVPLNSFTQTAPVLLVVGNEGDGLTDDVKVLCHRKIRIQSLQPSFSSDIDSLNVSVATGIMLHWLQTSRST